MAKLVVIKEGKSRIMDQASLLQESELQDLLEKYPSIIPMEEIGEESQLTLIGREVNLPSGSAVDLLYVDNDGVLTLVETKLAKNPEARRTVVGQIIEYASYVSRWTVDDVYQVAGGYSASLPADEDFQAKLAENLRKGKMRLIIAVDEAVEPLKSTVTFLNENSNFDIFLLVVRTFRDAEQRIVAPTLFGYPRPYDKKGTTWNLRSFLTQMEKHRGEEVKDTAYKLYQFLKSFGKIKWGTGPVIGSFTFQMQDYPVLSVQTDGFVYVRFDQLKDRVSRESLDKFRKRLNEIEGVNIGKEVLTANKYPSIKLELLKEEGQFEKLCQAVSQLCQNIQAAQPQGYE